MCSKPARSKPYPVEVQAGNLYYWCACGKSQKLPFCDGSHHGGPVGPVTYRAEATTKVWFCGCRRTAKIPLCDGSHDRCKDGPESVK